MKNFGKRDPNLTDRGGYCNTKLSRHFMGAQL